MVWSLTLRAFSSLGPLLLKRLWLSELSQVSTPWLNPHGFPLAHLSLYSAFGCAADAWRPSSDDQKMWGLGDPCCGSQLQSHSACLHRALLASEFTSCSVQFSSVAQSCPNLLDPVDCSTPGLPVHHQLLELAQTHVHRVGDATSLASLTHQLISSVISTCRPLTPDTEMSRFLTLWEKAMENQWSREDIAYNLLATFLSRFYSPSPCLLDATDSFNPGASLGSAVFSDGPREGQTRTFSEINQHTWVLKPFIASLLGFSSFSA